MLNERWAGIKQYRIDPDSTPNWKQLLGSDDYNLYGYVLPRNPETVKVAVFTAIFKTLTSRDLIGDNQSLLVEMAGTPERQRILSDIFKSEMDGFTDQSFQQERDEAKRRSNEAVRNIRGYQPLYVQYDYWQDAVPIKSRVSLATIEGYPDYLTLMAPTSSLLGFKGFPSLLIRRHWESRNKDRRGNIASGYPYQDLLTLVSRIGYSPEEIDLRIRNGEMHRHFTWNLEPGRTNTILEAHHFPTPDSNFTDFYDQHLKLLPFVYEQLTDAEKAQLLKPRKEDLSLYLDHIIQGEQKDKLSIIAACGKADISYDPNTKTMVGDTNKVDWVSASFELRPTLTPQTTHDSLLRLREAGLVLTHQLGL